VVLVSWNVAGRVARLGEQVERVVELDADVVCLQEVTRTTARPWRDALAAHGYRGVAQAELATAGRTLAVLTASRRPATPLSVDGLPLPERVLAVSLEDATEVVNVHSPISSRPDLAKVLTHEAVHRHLAAPAAVERLVCGDLNTPRKEHADGRVWTFARDRYGRLRPERGERWDAAELGLLRGLAPHGFTDAFRAVHGYGQREISWSWPRYSGGYRLDHLIVSAGVDVLACWYEHGWRECGLSDHSPLIAELRLPGDRD
jgi:exonuclease III